MSTCPVCGYDKIDAPSILWQICPCCGVEFGLSDRTASYEELRRLWLEEGRRWWSPRRTDPADWDPIKVKQLRDAGIPVSRPESA